MLADTAPSSAALLTLPAVAASVALLASRSAAPRAAHRRHPAIVHRRYHVAARVTGARRTLITVRVFRLRIVLPHQVLYLAAHTVRPARGAVVP